jgi:hypothetical protein
MSVLRRYGLQGTSVATGIVESFEVLRKGKLKQLVIGYCASDTVAFTAGVCIDLNESSNSYATLGLTRNLWSMPLRSELAATPGISGTCVVDCNDSLNVGDIFRLHLTVSAGSPNAEVSAILVVEEQG